MARRFKLQEGHELRGFVIRLYPTKGQIVQLEVLAGDMRHAWNWLVNQTEVVLKAREGYAIRNKLVGVRPVRPNYDGLTPDESSKTKEAYGLACREWHHSVHLATKDVPECAFRNFYKETLPAFGVDHDYQMLARVIDWHYEDRGITDRPIKPHAGTLRGLAKNYFSKSNPNNRRKKFRKASDPMPLQTRQYDCFELGDFGSRGHTHKRADAPPATYYNCQISFNGLKIKGRLPGKVPDGRVVEGVSLHKEPDGWYASIKLEKPVRKLPDPIPGSVVGIDMGLDNIAAISEARVVANEAAVFPKMGEVIEGFEKPKRISNARGKAFQERIAARQAEDKPVGRLHQKAHRHVMHVLHNQIIKPLALIETIKIEKLNARIGQMGSSKTSVIRKAGALLTERYGSRVREVQPHYTSQDCSQCGFRSKESWSYEHGRYGECPQCGHKEDRDINAARNIAAKPVIPLEI